MTWGDASGTSIHRAAQLGNRPGLFRTGKARLESARSRCFSRNWSVGKLESLKSIYGARAEILPSGTESRRARLLLRLSNTTILNCFVMTPVEMRRYIALLNRVKPKLIVAYAGAMYELARFAEREGLGVEPQAAILTSADMLYPFMREKIEKAFQTTVYNRYGSREVGDIACERPGYRGLWVAPWGNYVEIIDSEGRRVPDGDEGDIAITSLTNFAMPLVRYRIGDRGVLAPRQGAERPRGTDKCWKESSADPATCSEEKRPAHPWRVLHDMLFFRDWIRKYQVIQKDPSRVVFRIVCAGLIIRRRSWMRLPPRPGWRWAMIVKSALSLWMTYRPVDRGSFGMLFLRLRL